MKKHIFIIALILPIFSFGQRYSFEHRIENLIEVTDNMEMKVIENLYSDLKENESVTMDFNFLRGKGYYITAFSKDESVNSVEFILYNKYKEIVGYSKPHPKEGSSLAQQFITIPDSKNVTLSIELINRESSNSNKSRIRLFIFVDK